MEAAACIAGVQTARTMVGCFGRDRGCREAMEDVDRGGEGAFNREEMVDILWAQGGDAGGGESGFCFIRMSSEMFSCRVADDIETAGKLSISISVKKKKYLQFVHNYEP